MPNGVSKSEAFKNVTAGIASICVALGILVGGGWTLYTFCLLNQTQRSQIELAALQQTISRQAVVEFKVTAEQTQLPQDQALYVAVVVRKENKGNRNVILQYGKHAVLRLYPVHGVKGGSITLGDVIEARPTPQSSDPKNTSPTSVVLRAGSVEYDHFFVKSPAPGLYWIVYAVNVPKPELEITRQTAEAAVDSGGLTQWSAGTFCVVLPR